MTSMSHLLRLNNTGDPLCNAAWTPQLEAAIKVNKSQVMVMSKDDGNHWTAQEFSSSFRKIADEIESTYVYQLQNSDWLI